MIGYEAFVQWGALGILGIVVILIVKDYIKQRSEYTKQISELSKMVNNHLASLLKKEEKHLEVLEALKVDFEGFLTHFDQHRELMEKGDPHETKN